MVEEKLTEILAPYKGERGALIPILQKVQETLGYLSQEAISQVAKFLKVSESEIFGVLSFYAQFRTTPVGRNRVMVCRGTACHVRGGERVLASVEQTLNIKEGESTPDLEYSLETVACIGACALAPTMMINKHAHGRLTPAKVVEIFTGEKKVDENKEDEKEEE